MKLAAVLLWIFASPFWAGPLAVWADPPAGPRQDPPKDLKNDIVKSGGGGAIDSGGGEYFDPEAHSAWFLTGGYLGDEPVRYCIEIAPDFPLPDLNPDEDIADLPAERLKRIRALISRAYQAWTEELQDGAAMFGIDHDPKDWGQLDLIRIQTRAVEVPCDGSEEVRFAFGTNDPRVAQHRQKFDKALGFVVREELNFGTARSKGLVWLAPQKSIEADPNQFLGGSRIPDWTLDRAIYGYLLHEIGHTLGIGHIPGTIMSLEVSSWVKMADSHRKNLETISQERTLILQPYWNGSYELTRDRRNPREPISMVGRITEDANQETSIRIAGESVILTEVGAPTVVPSSEPVLKYYLRSREIRSNGLGERVSQGEMGAPAYLSREYEGRMKNGSLIRVMLDWNGMEGDAPLRARIYRGDNRTVAYFAPAGRVIQRNSIQIFADHRAADEERLRKIREEIERSRRR